MWWTGCDQWYICIIDAVLYIYTCTASDSRYGQFWSVSVLEGLDNYRFLFRCRILYVMDSRTQLCSQSWVSTQYCWRGHTLCLSWLECCTLQVEDTCMIGHWYGHTMFLYHIELCTSLVAVWRHCNPFHNARGILGKHWNLLACHRFLLLPWGWPTRCQRRVSLKHSGADSSWVAAMHRHTQGCILSSTLAAGIQWEPAVVQLPSVSELERNHSHVSCMRIHTDVVLLLILKRQVNTFEFCMIWSVSKMNIKSRFALQYNSIDFFLTDSGWLACSLPLYTSFAHAKQSFSVWDREKIYRPFGRENHRM